MSTTDTAPTNVVAAQLSCKGCPLRVHGPVPLYVPLHVVGPTSVVVLPRPYSDVVTPAEDPRRAALIQQVPELAVFAFTYSTNCWSDPSVPIPVRAVNACKRHREAEVDTLRPTTILAFGDAASQQYLGKPLAKTAHQLWQHPGGAYVLPCVPGPLSDADIALLRTALARHELGYYDLS